MLEPTHDTVNKVTSQSAAASEGDVSGYRRVLWVALAVNVAMFLVEIVFGNISGSVSLLADAIDFFGDAVNYALSLWVLSSSLLWRSRLAFVKGAFMLGYGFFVLTKAAWNVYQGGTPEALIMGAVGLLALAANVGVAGLLYAYRKGDANRRSVWLCTRNDAIGNLAIVFAAFGVFGTGTIWPDVAVAVIMGVLAIFAGWKVIGQARQEIRTGVVSTEHEGHAH